MAQNRRFRFPIPTPEPDLAAWAQELDAAYRRTAAHLPANTDVRIERVPDPKTGRLEEQIVLTPLERLEEPAAKI